MVRFYLFILVLIINLPLLSQTKCDSVAIVFGSPEKLPEFDVQEFITKNIKYPETAKKDKIEGKVIVRFWIDTNGYTSEHTIIKGIREDLDEEVLQNAKLIKFDKPAMNRGKPIGYCFQFSVWFTLDNNVKNINTIKQKNGTKRQ